MTIHVVCPKPDCGQLYELGGMLDLGALPDTGIAHGTTEAVLSSDCPACDTHLEFRWTVSWRPPS
jgi:hypothetical protein